MSTPTFTGYKNTVEKTIAFWLWRMEENGDLPSDAENYHRSPFQDNLKNDLKIHPYGKKVNTFIDRMYDRIGEELKSSGACRLNSKDVKAIAAKAGLSCTLSSVSSNTVKTAVDVLYRGPWETI